MPACLPSACLPKAYLPTKSACSFSDSDLPALPACARSAFLPQARLPTIVGRRCATVVDDVRSYKTAITSFPKWERALAAGERGTSECWLSVNEVTQATRCRRRR